MDVSAYLRRIGYDGPLAPTLGSLRGLHRAHLFTIPFENLDIARGTEIVLDEERFFDKIVRRGRGGFCYELNGLFAALLRNLGFEVELLSARVPNAKGRQVHEYDHLALCVHPVDSQDGWLADVGFGDCFLEPLRLREDIDQPQAGSIYRLTHDGIRWMNSRRDTGDWNLLYDFTLTAHPLPNFAGMCRYHQTSPESPFTNRRICSRATPEGRITLADMRLICTANGSRKQRVLQDEAEYHKVLWEQFGVAL